MAEVENRKHSAIYLTRRIIGEVRSHPTNRDRRLRAVARSVLWQIRKRLFPKPVVRHIFNHSRIWLDPAAGSASNIIYFGDHFDLEEMTFLERFIQPGDVFIDAGANIGAYTIFAAELVGTDGHIHSFEAAPSLVDKLRANIELNELETRVTVHPMAVGDRAGRVRFHTGFDVSNTIWSDGDPPGRTTEVDMVSLDQAVEGRVDALKLDVEGAESMALTGFKDHMRSDDAPVVLIEILWPQLEALGSNYNELIQQLADYGYGLYEYSLDRGTLVPISGTVFGNAIAVPLRRIGWVEERLDPPVRTP